MAIPCPPEVHLELNVKRVQDLNTSKYIVTFEIVSSENIDKNVFIFKQLLDRDSVSGCFKAVFEAVATPTSMSEFRVDIPNEGQVFFRKNLVQLEFDSIPEALDTERLIRCDINQLVEDTEAILSTFQSETATEY